jgi:hypothetical protein
MSYDKQHTLDDCDKCQERVGKENLTKVPFIYKDLNDKVHPDLGDGYRQYYICKKCQEESDKAEWNKFKYGRY